MHVSFCYDIVTLSLLIVMIWVIYGAGGGLMGKKWEMMKWLHDKHHEKSISFSIKPVAIPIPLPLPIPVAMKAQKGDTKAEKPWKAESKDMFWKMMMVKMMKGDKGSKGCGQPMCCPQMMMMPKMKKGGNKGCMTGCNNCGNGCSGAQMNGWSMMPAMKASPMMCCDCSQMMMPMKGCDMGMNGGWAPMMMKGGWPPMMMKGGWPMMNGNMMCCPSNAGGGWPDEEEEEEEDWEDEEPSMMGWDTNVVPVYWHPSEDFAQNLNGRTDIFITSRKGDNSDDSLSTGKLLAYSRFFRKGINNFRNFESNF